MSCEGCEGNFYSLVKEFYKNDAKALKVFREHGVLPTDIICPTCGESCSFKPSRGTFYCKKVRRDARGRRAVCSFNVTERKGTFLDKTHIKPSDLLIFICCFLWKPRVQRENVKLLGLTNDTCASWKSLCYEVCEFWLEEEAHIGGLGKIVEIDEFKLSKTKYRRGRDVERKWVFGLLERETKKVLFFVVNNRNSGTLIPIIQRHVLPGTTVYSDKWLAYKDLRKLGYDHHRVNDSKEFVAVDGVHTKTIECSWCEAKPSVLRPGSKANMYSRYFARHSFIRAHPRDQSHHHFLKYAALLYKHPNLPYEGNEGEDKILDWGSNMEMGRQ